MFIKIFFGKVNPEKILDNEDTIVSFWGSEKYFSMLDAPINWEHGVFQYYVDDKNDKFWWTLDGVDFSKGSQEDFVETICKSLEKINERQFLAEIFEYLCVSVADPFDIEDDYCDNSYCVEDTNNLDISEYSNYNEKCKDLWVFEVTRYANPPVDIKENSFSILCENNEDELEMKLRFMFCIDKKN